MAIQFSNTSAGVVTLKPAATGSWSYGLPAVDGTAGYYLGIDGSGGYQWVNVGVTGANGATFGLNTSSPNATINVSTLTVSGGSASMGLALLYKGANGGFFAANVPDNTSTGGDDRGKTSWDMQQARASSNRRAGNSPSIILGGYNNGIGPYAAVNRMMIIGGGQSNEMNLVASKMGPAVILGGKSNVINTAGTGATTVQNTTILGGDSNNIDYAYACILNGYKARATTNFALVHGGDSFSNSGQSGQGQCQVHIFTGGTSTSNATATSLNNTSSPYFPVCQPKEVFHFYGYCSAINNSTYATAKSWYIVGCAKRTNAGNITFVGTPTITTIAEDGGAVSWNITVALDTTNQCVNTLATGAASTFIRWTLTYYMIEDIIA